MREHGGEEERRVLWDFWYQDDRRREMGIEGLKEAGEEKVRLLFPSSLSSLHVLGELIMIEAHNVETHRTLENALRRLGRRRRASRRIRSWVSKRRCAAFLFSPPLLLPPLG